MGALARRSKLELHQGGGSNWSQSCPLSLSLGNSVSRDRPIDLLAHISGDNHLGVKRLEQLEVTSTGEI